MEHEILTYRNNADNIAKKRVETIKRRLLYSEQVIVNVTFELKESKNKLYYYVYKYDVEGGEDSVTIKTWLRKLLLGLPWDIIGNSRAIVL